MFVSIKNTWSAVEPRRPRPAVDTWNGNYLEYTVDEKNIKPRKSSYTYTHMLHCLNFPVHYLTKPVDFGKQCLLCHRGRGAGNARRKPDEVTPSHFISHRQATPATNDDRPRRLLMWATHRPSPWRHSPSSLRRRSASPSPPGRRPAPAPPPPP